MVQPVDAVSSFTHLTTNIPEWIRQIDALASHAAEKHAEFVAEYSRLLTSAKPVRLKSPSITSIHSADQKPILNGPISVGEETPSESPEFTEISPFEAGNRYLYAQARRKRKATSSVRSGASGPQKFRSKQSVVIYYDAFMQEQLDIMVRNIATARNNVRKGKLSRSLQKGLPLPTFSRRFPEIFTSSTEDVTLPQIHHSAKPPPLDSTTTPTLQPNRRPNDSCFCETDKSLETAQSLCETAAHQFLRDGDCKLELEAVKTHFKTVLTLATNVLPIYQAEKTCAEEEEERQQQQQQQQEEGRTDSEETLCEKSSDEAILSAKLSPHAPSINRFVSLPATATVGAHPPNLAGIGTAEIEVDDDDGSSIDVDISKFRNIRGGLGGRMGLRSSSGY